LSDQLLGILILLAGLFAMAGGILNWNWFMNNRRARIFVNVLGRGGARVFYVGLGLLLAVMGLLAMLGVISAS
jgi:hypothetical protein